MKCAYCGNNINTPFTAIEENGERIHFCDMLCGRLYDINCSPITPLMREYNKSYVKNKLTPMARMTFERLNDFILFKMIPVCSVKDTPEQTKRYYNQLFGI
jgi:hypothetical protein